MTIFHLTVKQYKFMFLFLFWNVYFKIHGFKPLILCCKKKKKTTLWLKIQSLYFWKQT